MTYKPNRWRKMLNTVLVYALLLAVALFSLFPFIWTFAISITNKNVTSGVSIYDFPASLFPKNVTLNNFQQVIEMLHIGKPFLNSIIITGLAVFGTLLISAMAAYPLARLNFPFKNIIFTAILLTMVLPSETSFIVNTLTLKHLGLLGTYWGVVLPIIATAFGIFLMRQAYATIPEAILDAARIDGASEMQILWRIMIPLSMPSLTALGIFTMVNVWNAYVWPKIALLGAQDLEPLSVAVLKLKGQFNYDPFNIAAGAIIMMLPVLIIFILAQRYFMRGLDGAVK